MSYANFTQRAKERPDDGGRGLGGPSRARRSPAFETRTR